jgi:hypothetical protein
LLCAILSEFLFNLEFYFLLHVYFMLNNGTCCKMYSIKLVTVKNSICGIMDSMFASTAVECDFEPWSGETKDYNIGICCSSTKHLGVGAKTGRLRIRIMCLSGAACLLVNCCFSQLAL